MGLRHTLRAFRCTDLAAFKEAMKRAAEKSGGSLRDEAASPPSAETVWVAEGGNAISLVYPARDNLAVFIRDLSWALGGAPYLEARIQEGSHWDYSLCRGMECLDQFSTHPSYWDGEDDPLTRLHQMGRPEMLSLVFGVPTECFEGYLKHWYSDWDEETEEYRVKREGKAYPEDRSAYGDYEQLWDFLRSLGISDPCGVEETERHAWVLTLPEPVRG
jgi:hypothetical protein